MHRIVCSNYDAGYAEVRLVDYEFACDETLVIVLVAVSYFCVLLYMKFVESCCLESDCVVFGFKFSWVWFWTLPFFL